MAQVLGVGGIFFKSKDPKALMDWYQRALGVPGEHGYAVLRPEQIPPGGATVFSPFKQDSDKFAPGRDFMFNLMVDDLDGALRQVQEAGGQLVGEREDYGDFGLFGWFMDPDGNKVELWQPKAKGAEKD
ncbi:VOC family protein [Massilia arenosa]|uniref:VOC family protein n=1 Tax=Zemynaea arenosa TaxID=2561931 RepID=A0A4Y9STU0_9BURK|nr:VOC family protein [Massilia arenosa]TFW28749.1 VOC family protein [Massilia arenosa]